MMMHRAGPASNRLACCNRRALVQPKFVVARMRHDRPRSPTPDRRRFRSRGAAPVRQVRARRDRPARLSRRRGEIRRRRRHRGRPARSAEPELRARRAGGQDRSAHQGRDRRLPVAARLRQRPRHPRTAGERTAAGSFHGGDARPAAHPRHPREPRPQPAHRRHRAPPRRRQLHRLCTRRSLSTGRLSGRRRQGARDVRQARSGEDARGLRRRGELSGAFPAATAGWVRWASAGAAE